MKTTELFVEQVIIGFIVLLIGALPFAATILESLSIPSAIHRDHYTAVSLGLAAGLVAAAYLIGLLVDRCSDTLLQDIEGHNRLAFAGEQIRKSLAAPSSLVDAFPEHIYRIATLGSGEAVKYVEYLRSRLRLTRALTILAPALGISCLLYLLRVRQVGIWWHDALLVVGIAYALAFLSKVFPLRLLMLRSPRTDDSRDKLKRYFTRAKNPFWRVWFHAADFSVLAFVFVIAYGVRLAAQHGPTYLWVPIAAGLVTLVAGWSWSRISTTFWKFLRDYATHGRPRGGVVG